MDIAPRSSCTYRVLGWVLTMAVWWAIPADAADLMLAPQQNALVQKYCAVCHTDVAKNGGLSLERYDAGQANPALAAMLLSKLNGGAMGAAGLKVPEQAVRDAWIAATTAQARHSDVWTVIRSETPKSAASVVVASIVRDVASRRPDGNIALYRLSLACNSATRLGEIQLAWSPQPQTDRTFFVSADGNPGIQHRLEGREEKMGNGTALTAGLAATMLNVPMPEKTLTVTDLFPGETIVFPFGELDQVDWRQLASCFSGHP